ncbi:uncharacterized protein LOC132319045 isoform X2 [Gavia stellata]|uniref:uncharacterized protein LOC132319045 isoform X2 n=1 Tax=Gavia stellata TaxID=37040 RepID=UPI0028A044E0|nr:uncharacterized protein LOC132319045 isoform X2 [Gavia stellata]
MQSLVRKARAFRKKTEPMEKSPARQCREAVGKEPDDGSLAPVLGESPCLQASAEQTLGAVRKHAAGVTHEPGRTDKDPGSQHFVTDAASDSSSHRRAQGRVDGSETTCMNMQPSITFGSSKVPKEKRKTIGFVALRRKPQLDLYAEKPRVQQTEGVSICRRELGHSLSNSILAENKPDARKQCWLIKERKRANASIILYYA